MRDEARLAWSMGCALTLLALASQAVAEDSAQSAGTREFTVADSIEMTTIGHPEYWHHNQSLDRVANYSPDGTKVVVVLRRGNIKNGVTEYSLLLYRASELLNAPAPEVLLRMSSSSNREVFVDPMWLPDNRTLLFMAENPGEERQVYRFDTVTRKLEALTHSEISLTSFSASADGKTVLYVAENPPEPLWNDQTRRHGVVVTNQKLVDLVAGRHMPVAHRGRLYVQQTGADGAPAARRIEVEGTLDAAFTPLISPDGRLALVRVHPATVPQKWRDYTDQVVRSAIPDEPLEPDQVPGITQFVIIDVQTGEVRTRIDAPQPYTNGGVYAEWARDSASLLFTFLYLPLDGVSAEERQRRASGAFIAQVHLSGRVSPLAPTPFPEFPRIERWDSSRQIAVLVHETLQGVRRQFFRRRGERWHSIPQPSNWRAPLELALREAMNEPPRIVVVDREAGREVTLLDLNPQLKELKLGRQEEIEWLATDGTRVRGGLYYPPSFVRGKRYPLVIQTHGWNPKLFAPDGVFTSPFAAQALANRDIMVLQAWDFPEEGNEEKWREWLKKVSSVALHQFEQEVYNGAVDHLDAAGLIDRNRVGLIGFSFTCWSVKYVLSHPKPGYRYAAASVSDGFDGGYFDYIVRANDHNYARQFENAAGGEPWGAGLQAWLENSPAFNVHRVETPLRMVPFGNPSSLLSDWEWYTLMRRMNKPVEVVLVEDGTHTLVKPWDRLVANGGNVDWFDFWLNGRKDDAPEKAEQYARWEKMRERFQFAR